MGRASRWAFACTYDEVRDGGGVVTHGGELVADERVAVVERLAHGTEDGLVQDHHEEQEEVSAAHDQPPHDHEDSDLDAPTTSHSDISATYTFKCESDDTLTQMTFGQDELPYRLERIDVFWVADWGQGAGQATPQSPQVSLRK